MQFSCSNNAIRLEGAGPIKRPIWRDFFKKENQEVYFIKNFVLTNIGAL